MASRTRIGHLVLVRHGRSDEAEGVRANERARHTLGFDPGHVTCHTLTPWAAVLVMSMFFESRSVRPIR